MVYVSIKVWQELEKTTRSSASLQLLEASMFIAGDVFKAKVNIDCCLVFVVSVIFKSVLITLKQAMCEIYLLSI